MENDKFNFDQSNRLQCLSLASRITIYDEVGREIHDPDTILEVADRFYRFIKGEE